MLHFVFLCYNGTIIEIGEMCVKRFLGIMTMVIAGVLFLAPTKADAARIELKCTDSEQLQENQTFLKTCTISLTGNTQAVDGFTGTITLSEGLTLGTEVIDGEGWIGQITGNTITFTPSTLGSSVTAETIVFGSFTVNVPADAKNCNIRISPTNMPVPEVTVEIEVEQQTQTGVALPMVVIGCGVVVAGVVYYLSKKNTKLYKI